MGSKSTVRTTADGGRTTKENRNFWERLDRMSGALEQRPAPQGSASIEVAPQYGPGGHDRSASEKLASGQFIAPGARAAQVGSTPLTAPAAATEAVPAVSSWGWLPALVLIAAFGLVSVGRAMQLALEQRPGASFLLWLGLLLIYVPVAFRMALPQTPRRERIALAVWLGLALYLVKILRSPAGFTIHDEFPHFATADMIVRTGHLFGPTSLQEVSAFFPGLEIVTSALVSVGGLSVEAAGLVVIGVARIIAALAIYLLYEEISGSPRVAGIGSVLAIVYPNYILWSSQYSYESLALPLSVLVLAVGLFIGRRNASRVSLTVIALVLTAGVVITHHVTSYFLASALVAIVLVARFGGPLVSRAEHMAAGLPRGVTRLLPWTLWTRPTEHTTRLRDWAPLAATAVSLVAFWLFVQGREIVRYIGPHLQAASLGFVALLTRSNSGRTPFSSTAATPTAASATAVPVWEQLVAFGAVLLIIGLMPFGLLQVWRRYRRHAMALFFAAATIAYPVTLVLRMSRGGSEIANRSWDFLFVAFGFVLAAGVAELWMARERVVPRAAAFSVYAGLLLMGAFIVATPAWARLPGPFLVGGDTGGVQAESYAASSWAREVLGPDKRFIADYSNKLLLGSFGEQYIVDGASWVFVSPKLSPQEELADLINRGVEYIVVDDRLTTDVPRNGHYFEPGEPESPWKSPLPAAHLAKFDREPCLNRVFDSGHITIYAVSAACAQGKEGTE
jgi:hypothetical protein